MLFFKSTQNQRSELRKSDMINCLQNLRKLCNLFRINSLRIYNGLELPRTKEGLIPIFYIARVVISMLIKWPYNKNIPSLLVLQIVEFHLELWRYLWFYFWLLRLSRIFDNDSWLFLLIFCRNIMNLNLSPLIFSFFIRPLPFFRLILLL